MHVGRFGNLVFDAGARKLECLAIQMTVNYFDFYFSTRMNCDRKQKWSKRSVS